MTAFGRTGDWLAGVPGYLRRTEPAMSSLNGCRAGEHREGPRSESSRGELVGGGRIGRGSIGQSIGASTMRVAEKTLPYC